MPYKLIYNQGKYTLGLLSRDLDNIIIDTAYLGQYCPENTMG
jgi:hypothetical protein